MNSIGKATCTYEKIKAGISAVGGTVIAIILIVAAILIIINNRKKIYGTITSIKCDSGTSANQASICQITVSFESKGSSFTSIMIRPVHNILKLNQKIPINVVSVTTNPPTITIDNSLSNASAYVMLGLAALILLLGWGFFYLIRRNASFCSVMGTMDIAQRIL